MKIAMLSGHLSRTGSGVKVVVEELSQALCRQGHEVHVFGLADKHWYDGDDADWSGAPASAFKTIGPTRFGYAPKLGATLRNYAPDVIHAHGIWMYGSVVAASLAGSGVPNVVSPHGMLDSWALERSALLKRFVSTLFERSHLGNASCRHALNKEEHDAVREYGLGGPVAILPNGVNLPTTDVAEHAAPTWREKLPDDAQVMLFLGRLHRKKNLKTLISTWHESPENWHLVIVGPNEDCHRADLEAHISHLPADVAARILFTGALFGPEKAAAFAHSNAFILPSFSEGLPVAVLEAWAHQLPVLMTSECNLAIGFAEGAALEIGTKTHEIAPVLTNFFKMTTKQREKMGENGYRLAADRYSWDSVAKQFSELYAWCIADGSREPPTFVTQAEDEH